MAKGKTTLSTPSKSHENTSKKLDLSEDNKKETNKIISEVSAIASPVSTKKTSARSVLDTITPKKPQKNRKSESKTIEGDQEISVFNASDLEIKDKFGFPSINISSRVDKIYKVIRKMTGTLGGNGYNGAIYGELTMHSTHIFSINNQQFIY